MKKLSGALFALMITLSCMKSDLTAQGEYKLVSFTTDDGGSIEAALFTADAKKIIIYAHGAVFDKESWYFLANRFQKENVSSLCLDFRGYGNSTGPNSSQKHKDILGALDYLNTAGYQDIYMIGGSMGGTAVLDALSHMEHPSVKKVVLLAPAGGPPMSSTLINKLIIVSRGEGHYVRVKEVYDNSENPKILREYDGSAHAQHMFKEEYAEELIQIIIDFIMRD